VSRRIVPLLIALAVAVSACAWDTRDLAVAPAANAQSSFIYDSDGNLLTVFRGEQNRINARTLDDVPDHMQDAVVAIEDERFWLHQGVDLRAVLRAARSNVSTGGISEGGSTITQQYVGLQFLDRGDRSAGRKTEEIALALQFERQYTKDFILLEYLNAVYFGEGAYGVIAAASEYFDKELNDLTIAEAAIIAGLIQAPGGLNPYDFADDAIERREEVLDRMLANEWITEKEFEQANTEPLKLAPRVQVLEETFDAPYFVEEVRKWVLSDPMFGETFDDRFKTLYEGGLQIHTTVDRELQRRTEAAVLEVLPDTNGPRASTVVIENDTGYVRAMVGGDDFFSLDQDAEFNLATQGSRQIGSSFKPFVLAAALEQGMGLETVYPAPKAIQIPIPGFDQPWSVKGGSSAGSANLEDATVYSYNTVFAQLMVDVTPAKGVEMAQRLGVESELTPVYAAVLGTEDMTMWDLSSAYSTFARRGVYLEPAMVTHVLNPDGTVFYEHTLQSHRVIDSTIADTVTNTLTQVVERGTGTSAQIDRPVAGKTGTAENYNDATFAGYSPQYTAAVWVGFPAEQISMQPPTTPIRVFGGTYPAAIWKRIMTIFHEGQPILDFPEMPASVKLGKIPGETTIPNVVGQNINIALATLDRAFLTVTVNAFNSTGVAPGTVLSQSPVPGGRVPSGTNIVLEIAATDDLVEPEEEEEEEPEEEVTPEPGPEEGGGVDPEPSGAEIPGVVGLTSAEARGFLLSAGFNVTEIVEPGGAAPGTVYQQSPGAGTRVNTGATVAIWIEP
jgi:penicillin-binding protein 1A